jgi:hypothetical protein
MSAPEDGARVSGAHLVLNGDGTAAGAMECGVNVDL